MTAKLTLRLKSGFIRVANAQISILLKFAKLATLSSRPTKKKVNCFIAKITVTLNIEVNDHLELNLFHNKQKKTSSIL